MAVLSAALAFAITMLILSMVASVTVETIHRLIGMRENGLRIMLGHVYDRVISPYLTKQGADAAALKLDFVDAMTVNRAPAGQVGKKQEDMTAGLKSMTEDTTDIDRGLFSRIWSGRRLARLSANEFMSRLGGSEFGDMIRGAVANSGVANADDAIKDIATRFDQFGREAGVFFESRARLLSVLVAMIVAWLMYVHPYELFSTYMKQPAVAEAVIALQDAKLAEFEKRLKEKEEALEQSDEAGKPEKEKALADVRAEMNSEVEKLQSLGVAIGWTDERLAAAGFVMRCGVPLPGAMVDGKFQLFGGGNWFKTLIWLLFGGLLVGLGGPFWYDMVKSLSSIRTALAGAKGPANSGDGSGDGGKTGQDGAVDSFNTAAAGRDAANPDNSGDDEEPVG